MKNLETLLKCTDINYIVGDTNKEITDITADSREVKEGSLFICLDGAHVDGHNYAASAAQKGAAAIVASREIDVPEGTTVVYVTDTRNQQKDYNADNYQVALDATVVQEGKYVYLVMSPNKDALLKVIGEKLK